MIKCAVCGKFILFKKVRLRNGRFCHERCYIETDDMTTTNYLPFISEALLLAGRGMHLDGEIVLNGALKKYPNNFEILATKGMVLIGVKSKQSLMCLKKSLKIFEKIYGKDFFTTKEFKSKNKLKMESSLSFDPVSFYRDLVLAIIFVLIGLKKSNEAKKY